MKLVKTQLIVISLEICFVISVSVRFLSYMKKASTNCFCLMKFYKKHKDWIDSHSLPAAVGSYTESKIVGIKFCMVDIALEQCI